MYAGVCACLCACACDGAGAGAGGAAPGGGLERLNFLGASSAGTLMSSEGNTVDMSVSSENFGGLELCISYSDRGGDTGR